MAQAKDCHAMTSYFIKKYKEKYGIEPNVNRHSARWGFDAVLMGMSTVSTKELIDYYFTTASNRMHDIEWFFYNYEKLINSMNDNREDAAHRQRLMQESKERAEKWRQSGKPGIANHQRGTTE